MSYARTRQTAPLTSRGTLKYDPVARPVGTRLENFWLAFSAFIQVGIIQVGIPLLDVERK